jgi:hypothetical protein
MDNNGIARKFLVNAKQVLSGMGLSVRKIDHVLEIGSGIKLTNNAYVQQNIIGVVIGVFLFLLARKVNILI